MALLLLSFNLEGWPPSNGSDVRMRRRCCAIAFCFLMLTLSSAAAEASQVRVTNSAELRAAIGAAQPGDEIVVASGVYDTAGIDCSADGTATAPIVVKSETPLSAEIRFDALEGFHVYEANRRSDEEQDHHQMQ
jgi:hypothetical protein